LPVVEVPESILANSLLHINPNSQLICAEGEELVLPTVEVPESTILDPLGDFDLNSRSIHLEGEGLVSPIFGVLESTILTSPARVIDHYHSSHSSAKATSRQQGTPPKTGPRSPLLNLLRALFSKYVHSTPNTVAMTFLVP